MLDIKAKEVKKSDGLEIFKFYRSVAIIMRMSFILRSKFLAFQLSVRHLRVTLYQKKERKDTNSWVWGSIE